MLQDPLQPQLLISAYSQGYFPMPDPETEKVLWFRPDPRAIIPFENFHVSKSLTKRIRRQEFQATFNLNFSAVITGCANRQETWINDDFKKAYIKLHTMNIAHSVEIWQENALVGGTYGVAIGAAFFAESMFHKVTDASKIALYHLIQHLKNHGFELLECQFLTPHLKTLGAIEISDREYMQKLQKAIHKANVLF